MIVISVNVPEMIQAKHAVHIRVIKCEQMKTFQGVDRQCSKLSILDCQKHAGYPKTLNYIFTPGSIY